MGRYVGRRPRCAPAIRPAAAATNGGWETDMRRPLGWRPARSRMRIRLRLLAGAALVVLACGGIAAASEPADVLLDASGAARLQTLGYDGTGVTVAVIDSGVADVPGMGDSVIERVSLSAAPAAGDEYGHGTFVAGLVHQV